MSEPKSAKLSDLMAIKGKRKEKSKRMASSYKEAKEACGRK